MLFRTRRPALERRRPGDRRRCETNSAFVSLRSLRTGAPARVCHSADGVIITSVDPGSAAEEAGLERGHGHLPHRLREASQSRSKRSTISAVPKNSEVRHGCRVDGSAARSTDKQFDRLYYRSGFRKESPIPTTADGSLRNRVIRAILRLMISLGTHPRRRDRRPQQHGHRCRTAR